MQVLSTVIDGVKDITKLIGVFLYTVVYDWNINVSEIQILYIASCADCFKLYTQLTNWIF